MGNHAENPKHWNSVDQPEQTYIWHYVTYLLCIILCLVQTSINLNSSYTCVLHSCSENHTCKFATYK